MVHSSQRLHDVTKSDSDLDVVSFRIMLLCGANEEQSTSNDRKSIVYKASDAWAKDFPIS